MSDKRGLTSASVGSLQISAFFSQSLTTSQFVKLIIFIRANNDHYGEYGSVKLQKYYFCTEPLFVMYMFCSYKTSTIFFFPCASIVFDWISILSNILIGRLSFVEYELLFMQTNLKILYS